MKCDHKTNLMLIKTTAKHFAITAIILSSNRKAVTKLLSGKIEIINQGATSAHTFYERRFFKSQKELNRKRTVKAREDLWKRVFVFPAKTNAAKCNSFQ